MTRRRGSSRLQSLEDLEAVVRAPIVDDDDFVRAPCRPSTRASAPRRSSSSDGASLRTGITTLRSVFMDRSAAFSYQLSAFSHHLRDRRTSARMAVLDQLKADD